jgi:hypothetical protein
MSDSEFLGFLQTNKFVTCPEHSIPEKGMSSRVDAFSNGDVLLRVVVDRGQRFVDLARPGTNIWTDVFTLASKVDGEFHVKTGSFSEAVRVLTEYWPKLI